MNWNYISDESESIYLHDHYISQILIDKDDIRLIFGDGFDILKTNPLNNTGKSKHTTKSEIILQNAFFLKGSVNIWNGKTKQEKVENLSFSTLSTRLLSSGFEVYDWTLKFCIESKTISLDGQLNQDIAQLTFACSGFLFCWNDYAEDAWFEGWPDNIKV